MSPRLLRLVLVVVFHIGLGAAAYQVWTLESRMNRDRDARAAWADRAARAAMALADLRAAQQAYVAVGQTPDFWAAQVTERRGAIVSDLTELRATATTETARSAVANAAAAMADFGPIDRRVREQIAMNQPLTASDLIFADGLETLQRAASSTIAATAAQDAAFGTVLASARREELAVVAGALAMTLLVTWLLVPTVRTDGQRSPAPAEDVPSSTPVGEDAPVGEIADARLSSLAPAPQAPTARVDVTALAQLCTDLGRVSNPADLPGLLGRAARVLDANGVVLWMADPAGNELLPSVAHGYPAHALSRLGGLRRDSDNATAAAYRSGLLQTVPSLPGQHGAIIAPLLTVSGCIGVVALEVRNQGEQDEGVRAASSLIAAQLATLVSAPRLTESPAADRTARS